MTEKIPIKDIRLADIDGECTVSSFEAANDTLNFLAKFVRGNTIRNVFYEVTYIDGFKASGTIGVERKHSGSIDLRQVIRRAHEIPAGYKPRWLDGYRWRLMQAMHRAIGVAQHAKALLTRYQL